MRSRELCLVGLLAAVPAMTVALLATTTNLTIPTIAEDAFYNYDFLSAYAGPSNVD